MKKIALVIILSSMFLLGCGGGGSGSGSSISGVDIPNSVQTTSN